MVKKKGQTLESLKSLPNVESISRAGIATSVAAFPLSFSTDIWATGHNKDPVHMGEW